MSTRMSYNEPKKNGFCSHQRGMTGYDGSRWQSVDSWTIVQKEFKRYTIFGMVKTNISYEEILLLFDRFNDHPMTTTNYRLFFHKLSNYTVDNGYDAFEWLETWKNILITRTQQHKCCMVYNDTYQQAFPVDDILKNKKFKIKQLKRFIVQLSKFTTGCLNCAQIVASISQ